MRRKNISFWYGKVKKVVAFKEKNKSPAGRNGDIIVCKGNTIF